jgi:hypothetical protein
MRIRTHHPATAHDSAPPQPAAGTSATAAGWRRWRGGNADNALALQPDLLRLLAILRKKPSPASKRMNRMRTAPRGKAAHASDGDELDGAGQGSDFGHDSRHTVKASAGYSSGGGGGGGGSGQDKGSDASTARDSEEEQRRSSKAGRNRFMRWSDPQAHSTTANSSPSAPVARDHTAAPPAAIDRQQAEAALLDLLARCRHHASPAGLNRRAMRIRAASLAGQRRKAPSTPLSALAEVRAKLQQAAARHPDANTHGDTLHSQLETFHLLMPLHLLALETPRLACTTGQKRATLKALAKT